MKITSKSKKAPFGRAKELTDLGMTKEIADFFYDRLNIRDSASLASKSNLEILEHLRNRKELVDELKRIDKKFYSSKIVEWINAARIKSDTGRKYEWSAAEIKKIDSVHAKMKTMVTKNTAVLRNFNFSDLNKIIFKHHKLAHVRALLRKAGIKDIKKVGKLSLEQDLRVTSGFYLPRREFIVDTAIYEAFRPWKNVVYTQFNPMHIGSIDFPVNEAVLIATELDLTDKKIIIDKSIDTFYIIAEKIIYGPGAHITYEPLIPAPAPSHDSRAQDGTDFNVNAYSGNGRHGANGGDGSDGATGFSPVSQVKPAPNLEIYVLELPGGLPDIVLSGQPGIQGGRGQRGGNGGDGAKGADAEAFTWFCDQGPGNGGRGGNGGNGGQGGVGSSGGNAGSLTVGIQAGNENQIFSRPTFIVLNGGQGGAPGAPGNGGTRGTGGKPGEQDWWEWCSSASSGSNGNNGSSGSNYPLHADPLLHAAGITTGHGTQGEPGLINPPVIYSRAEWENFLSQPWILRLDPNNIVASTATELQYVIAEGLNYNSTDTVHVNGIARPTILLSSSPTQARLRFEVPSNLSGRVSVQVHQSDFDESNIVYLTILPKLESASATDIIPGQEITLHGGGFQTGARVRFAGMTIIPFEVTPTEITVDIPSLLQLKTAAIGEGTNTIKIINADGSETGTIDLNLTYPNPMILIPIVGHRMISEDDNTIGTNATEDDVRDLFNNSDILPHRIGWTVNHLLSHTGIQFILHDIQENELEDDLMLVTPRRRIGEISARFNVLSKLDIYFLIVFDESFAWGGADQTEPVTGDPFDGVPASQQTGAAWMPNFLDIGLGNDTRDNWRSYVVAMSHEIGHFLTLPHFCSQVGDDPTGTETGAVCTAGDANQIMHPVVGANRSLYNENEISKSRSRADGYEVTL